jgi:OPA family glycerol-3-phosphate transporter-like MFS transporter
VSQLVAVINGTIRHLGAIELKRLSRWRVSTFWVMLLGYVGYYLCRGNLSAALPLLSETFGYTRSELGAIGGWATLAYAIGKFINGPLGDKIGGRKIFLIGMVGSIFANIMFAMSTGLMNFTLIWCVNRFFLSMGWGGIAKTIGAWYPPHRHGTIMGFISINFQFGGVAALLFSSILLSYGVSWQGLFLYPAAVLSLILIWSYLSSREAPELVVEGAQYHTEDSEPHHQIAHFETNQEKPGVTQILKTLFQLSIFRRLLVFSILTTSLRTFFIFWLPTFLVDSGLNNIDALTRSAFIACMGVLGTLLLGWYTDTYAKDGNRAHATWIMLSGLGVCLFAIAGLTEVGLRAQSLIVCLLGVSCFCLLGPYSMSSGAFTLDIAGSKGAGSCTGMIDGLGYVGGAVATWGAGKLADSVGWGQVFVLLAVCAFIATGAAYLMSKSYQQEAKKAHVMAV